MKPLRNRELLLSLKYCTIEACFSVPMLNLTLGNTPFIISFAVLVLGWHSTAIGLLAATPFLCLFLQPPLTYLLQQRTSLYKIMVLGFVLNALPWTLVAFFPYVRGEMGWIFALIVVVSNLSNAVCAVAWSAGISDLVPLEIRGRYFGRRNSFYGFWTLIVTVAAGQLVDVVADKLLIYGLIFTLAAAARLIGLLFLTRMRFPARVMERRPQASPFGTFTAVFRDRNFLLLMVFTGLFGLCLNLGSPFYSVFVLQRLPFSVGDLTVLTMLSSLGGLISQRTWGPLSDRFGNKPIMITSAYIWLAVAAASWLFSGPTRYLHLYANYFVTGFMMAGFAQIGQFNLMIKMVPSENKAHYISVFISFTNLLIGLGPMLGGLLLNALPLDMGTWLGQPLTRFQPVIVFSLVLGLLCLQLLQLVREPQEKTVRELVGVMSQMREFNPLMGISDLAQGAFTPRGVMRLAKSSLRQLRRHTGAVSDVGEELVEGGWHAIRKPFRRPPE